MGFVLTCMSQSCRLFDLRNDVDLEAQEVASRRVGRLAQGWAPRLKAAVKSQILIQ